MGLITFTQQLIADGAAKGWQSFGYGSEWNGSEQGQDIGLTPGTPVPASAGVVTAISQWYGADYGVTEQLPDGTLLTAGHINPAVTVGQTVQDGDILGYSGGLPSPISSGPHIEVRVQPSGSRYVDPVPWLRTANEAATTMARSATGGPSLFPSFTGITIGPVHLDRTESLLAAGVAAFLLL